MVVHWYQHYTQKATEQGGWLIRVFPYMHIVKLLQVQEFINLECILQGDLSSTLSEDRTQCIFLCSFYYQVAYRRLWLLGACAYSGKLQASMRLINNMRLCVVDHAQKLRPHPRRCMQATLNASASARMQYGGTSGKNATNCQKATNHAVKFRRPTFLGIQ